MIKLRWHQDKIVNGYHDGLMGVSAVPGSGKTTTLSMLAARLVAQGRIKDDQEILVVTLVNSAVESFSQKIGSFLNEMELIRGMGYRVRTLHGLANDIVHERPALVGLAEDFTVLDDRDADLILDDVCRAWYAVHPNFFNGLLTTDMEENKAAWIRREMLPGQVVNMAKVFIGYGKDHDLTPDEVFRRVSESPAGLPLAQMGADIYREYQRALNYRGAVDFADLIRLAYQALESDRDLVYRLQCRWPLVLEDEAQDSSLLQEKILRKLVGDDGGWVRVGDPNQAIFETFTNADPRFLRDFIKEPQVVSRELPVSGRSTVDIINLANHLIEWNLSEHPVPDARDALSAPFICPTEADDPRPNPPPSAGKVVVYAKAYTPAEEIDAVADSLARWLPGNSEKTVAILVPRNKQGFDFVDALEKRKIPCVDGLLRSSTSTRLSAELLSSILAYLADSRSGQKLAKVYRSVMADPQDDEHTATRVKAGADLLQKCSRLEEYLWPRPEADYLETSGINDQDPDLFADLLRFREIAQRWQNASYLPVDQLLVTLAQDLFVEPARLALSFKLAGFLHSSREEHPDWRLAEFAEVVTAIAKNQRKFIGFGAEETGFDPDQFRGRVVVATVHKAKGLEWDRVYLPGVNDYDYPGGLATDHFIAEQWYVRDGLNLGAETLAQLRAALSHDEYDWYDEGAETQKARIDYARERMRLLYVGITRARHDLIVTWNKGPKGRNLPSVGFNALYEFASTMMAAQ